MSLGNTFIGYGGTMKRAVVSIGKTSSSSFTFSCNGKTYGSEDTFTATVGDVLTVEFSTGSSYNNGYLYVNGTSVSSGINGNSMTYNYTIQNSVDITFKISYSGYYSYYYCYITDNTSVQGGYERSITEGVTLVNHDGQLIKSTIEIIGKKSNYEYIIYNGIKYYAGDTFTASVGDTINANMNYMSASITNYIYVDGKIVKDANWATISYDYTITGNTLIKIDFETGPSANARNVYISKSKSVYAPVHKIDGGVNLLDGVSYTIGTTAIYVTISKNSSMADSRASCKINEVTYSPSDSISDLKVRPGDIIVFSCQGSNGSSAIGKVTINGEVVAQSTNMNYTTTYNWTVPIRIKSIKISFGYVGEVTGNGSVIVTTS